MDRLQNEQVFHDRQANHRASDFRRRPDQLHFSDDEYLDHANWIRPAFKQLGSVAGKRILDFGCGHAMAAIVMARRGARVTAFDLSLGYLAEARRRADVNGVSVRFLQADGEHLPFADASFDAVWGNAILHHLDLQKTGKELQRVLAPDGVAVFCEPWGENPLLNWARSHLPYPGKGRTPDEEPLRTADLKLLEPFFQGVKVQGYQFLSMIDRVVPVRPLTQFLQRCDEAVLARHNLQRFCRYMVITLRR